MRTLALFALTLTLIALPPLAAQAQEAPALTRDVVEAFYADSDRIQLTDPTAYPRFIAERAREDATFSVNMTAPGRDGAPMTQQITFTKPQLVQILTQAAATPGHEQISASTVIDGFDVSPDGLARTIVTQESTSRVEGPQGPMHLHTRSTCQDVFTPSATTGLAYVSSACQAVMTAQAPQAAPTNAPAE